MNLRYSVCVAFCISLASLSVHAAAKTETGGLVAKADQDVIRQAAKSGLSTYQVRELSAAMKQDRNISEAVKGAMDKGMQKGELADFVQKEIKNRQGMMGQGQGMGQGMMSQGQGMGQGMMGQGRGMGSDMSMGSGQAMNGSGMRTGMGRSMGGCGMGRGMRGGR